LVQQILKPLCVHHYVVQRSWPRHTSPRKIRDITNQAVEEPEDSKFMVVL
jgi:hypothetical protein